jgi:Mrp family chromosome partitioning ATPase
MRNNAVELESLSGYLMNDAGKGEVASPCWTPTFRGCERRQGRRLRPGCTTCTGSRPRRGCRRPPGLADVLVCGYSCKDALQDTEQENLRIMAAGGGLAGSIGRREVDVLRQTLADPRGVFDYVIVDGSHYFSSSDVSLFAHLFDGIVFVIEREKTSWEVVQQATEGLRKSGGRLLGAVLNKRRYYIPGKLYGRV